VATVAFFHPTKAVEQHPVTEHMINSFTTIVLLVVGFYFGFHTVEKVAEKYGGNGLVRAAEPVDLSLSPNDANQRAQKGSTAAANGNGHPNGVPGR
jgi:hypothetical protein